MNKLTTRIAAVATLALAALPFAALATNAAAAPAPVAIKIADLDLNSAQGLATFHSRAEAVVNSFCSDADPSARQMRTRADCRIAVREEISDKLAAAQQTQLAAKGGKATVTLAAR